MPNRYVRTYWVDEQTPINAEHMNNIEEGVVEASEAARRAATRMEIVQDDTTGIVTISLYNSFGEKICERTLDLETEKIIESVSLDYEHALLVFNLHDGTKIYCNISELKNIIEEIQTEIGDPSDDYTKNTIYGKIANEEKERVEADQTLATNLEHEIENRIADVNAEETRAKEAEEALENTINAMDLNQVGGNGKYIKYISQADGQVSANEQNFDTDMNNATDNNAPTTKNVKDYVDTETSRAEGAESSLDNKITAERARAENQERLIRNSIGDYEQADASENTVYGHLKAEETRAKEAEEAINTKIGTPTSSNENTVYGRFNLKSIGNLQFTHNSETGKITFTWTNVKGETMLDKQANLQLNTNQIITDATLIYDLTNNVKKIRFTLAGKTGGEYNTLDCDISTMVNDILNKISAETVARVDQIGDSDDTSADGTVYGYINGIKAEIEGIIGTKNDQPSESGSVYAYIKKKDADIEAKIGNSSSSDTSTVYGYINDAINDRKAEAGHSIFATQDANNNLVLQLLNYSGEILDTETIDLQINDIITNVDLDYSNKKLVFTLLGMHEDPTTHEQVHDTFDCDLTTLIDTLQNQITANTNDIANYKTGIEVSGGNVQIKHNATIEGDLLVKGTTTTSDQETIQSKAAIIVTNSENVQLVNFTGTVALKGTFEKYEVTTYKANTYYYLEIDPVHPTTYEYVLDDSPTQTVGRQYYVPRGEAASVYDKAEDSLLLGEGLYIDGDFYFTDYYNEVTLTVDTYEPNVYYILTQYKYYDLATGTFDPNEVYYEKIIQTHGENIATRDLSRNLNDGHLLKWDAENFTIVDSGKTYTDIETLVSTEIAKQVHGLSAGTTENHILVFGTDGYHIKDSGKTLDDTGKVDTISITGTDVPADAHKNIDLPTVRTDTNAQGLSSTQKTNAKTNLDLNNVENRTMDNVPTENSDNYVKSGGVYSHVQPLKERFANDGLITLAQDATTGTLTNEQQAELVKNRCVIYRGTIPFEKAYTYISDNVNYAEFISNSIIMRQSPDSNLTYPHSDIYVGSILVNTSTGAYTYSEISIQRTGNNKTVSSNSTGLYSKIQSDNTFVSIKDRITNAQIDALFPVEEE